MRHYKIGYFFSQAFLSFKRNAAMSVASILVLAASLIITGSFSLLIVTMNSSLSELHKLDKVIVYLNDGVQIDEVTAKLDGKSMKKYIDEYTVITKEEALENQKHKYEEHPEIFDSLGNDNPLPDAIEIKYNSSDGALKELKSAISSELVKKGLIEEKYVSSYDVITQKLEGLKHSISVIFIALWALVFLVAVLVIVNTIKLSVHARADEIGVMRLIGAGNWFITLPFVLESFYVAVIALVIAFPVQWYLYEYVFARIVENVSYIKMLEFSQLAPNIAILFAGFGIIVGMFASIFSVKKYSKK